MPESIITTKNQYLDVLNLLGARRVVYSNLLLNLIHEKTFKHKAYKYYATKLKNILSEEQTKNVSAWIDEIISKANVIRGERRDRGEIYQYRNNYDYDLMAPVSTWAVCLTAIFHANINGGNRCNVELQVAVYPVDISQIAPERYTARLIGLECNNWSFTEPQLIETMKEIKNHAENLLGNPPDVLYEELEYRLSLSKNTEMNNFTAEQQNRWVERKVQDIANLSKPHS